MRPRVKRMAAKDWKVPHTVNTEQQIHDRQQGVNSDRRTVSTSNGYLVSINNVSYEAIFLYMDYTLLRYILKIGANMKISDYYPNTQV